MKKLYLTLMFSVCTISVIAISSFYLKPTFSTPEVKAVSEHPNYIPTNYKNIGDPYVVIVLPDGNLWYTDPLNGRIVKISESGVILRTVGRYGNAEGEFPEWITGITRDNDGYLYVQTGAHTIKLDSNGGYITTWGSSGNGNDNFSNASWIHYDAYSDSLVITDKDNHRIKRHTRDGAYITQFGTYGSGNGEFVDAQAVTTDSNGRIYVTDSEPNCRVEAFTPTGEFLFNLGGPPCGIGDGQLIVPRGVVVKPNGNIVVASTHGHKMQEFNASGTWISSWGEQGSNAWQIEGPLSLALDSSGNYFLTDVVHRAIQKFTSSGVYITSIRNGGLVGGRLTSPTSMAYDSIGNLYVLDNGAYTGRVQKFTNAGTYLTTIIQAPTLGLEAYYMTIKNDEIYIADHISFKKFDLAGNLLLTVEAEGTGNGQFIGARGIAVDSLGNIYVGDSSRVQKFDAAGTYLTQWGVLGTGNGQFGSVNATIVIDASDNIYVADNVHDAALNNTRIQVFDSSGTYLRTIGSYGTLDGQFMQVGGMAFDLDGRLHVSEPEANTPRVQVFNVDGSFSRIYGNTIGSGIEEFVEPRGLALNPISGNISIADTANHRVQLIPSGTRIINLISSADVLSTTDSASLVNKYFDPLSLGADSISSQLYFGENVVSDFTVDLSSDRDWSSVNIVSSTVESKSFIANLNPTLAPGVSATHSLYVLKQVGQTNVIVCPNAVTVEEVTPTCVNGYTLTEGDPSLSSVTVGGKNYWKVTGLTGTGIMSETPIITPTPTITTTPLATPTPTPTPTATPTITTTPTTSITPYISSAVTTITPVQKPTTPECPEFTSFTTPTLLIKKGESVTFRWVAKQTESVRVSSHDELLPAIGSFLTSPVSTTDYIFTAENGYCLSKKTVTITVVDTLPWTNTVAVGTGIIAVEAALAVAQPAIFGNLWLAMAGLISRKKYQAWGLIYDSKNKKPLGRAVIRLQDSAKTVVNTVVSEANGTFKLTVKPGNYTLTVTLAGFHFPSQLQIGESGKVDHNVYLGNEFSIKDETENIIFSIPVDSVKLSEQETREITLHNSLHSFIDMISKLLMLGGFIYSVSIAIIYPHINNYAIMGVYLVILVGKLIISLPKKTHGTVKNTNGDPISGLEIGLYDPEFQKLLYRTFTNNSGEYSFIVPNQTYSLKILDNKYKLLHRNETVPEFILQAQGKDEVRIVTNDISIR